MERLLWKEKRHVCSRSVTLLRTARLLLLLNFLAGATFLHAAKFTASLERETIALGENVTLSLTFEGGSPKALPELPAIPGLQVAPGISHSSRQSFDFNGNFTAEVTYAITLVPQKVGAFTIPSLTAEVGNEKLNTQPLKLKVLQPSAPSTEDVNAGSQVAFFKLALPKKEVYLGEVITGELQFYYRQGLQLIEPRLTATPAEGFIIGKIAAGRERPVRVGNTVFNMLPASVAFTAVKTGPLSIGPITASIQLAAPPRNIQEMMRGGERQQLSIATQTETVQSLPLPAENVPASFNGAVGSYAMTASAGPTNVATGDPITVKVQIAGRGALEALTLPEQTAWHDFKTYPPTTDVKLGDQLGLQGTKTFEQIIVPQTTDIKELPPFSFSFFDPDAKAYRTLTQPAVKLAVRSGGTTVAPVIAANKTSAPDNPPPAQDIVPIKQRLGSLAQAGPPLVQRPWFIAVQGAPLLAWLCALGWRKRADALANNPRLRRRRLVAKIIREGLSELRRLAAENKSDEFFVTLFRLLQEQLGERLNCPASSITEAVIDEKLRPRAVPETTLLALHELFQTCNLARYAPIKSSQELAALVPKLEAVLADLQKVRA
jgi:hypothetical protein